MSDTFKEIKLTDRDFDLIIDGLKDLPNRSTMGNIIGEALSKAMDPKNEGEGFHVFELNMADLKRKSELSRKDLMEEVTILQGKLLQLKRLLKAENLMSDVGDILGGNHKPSEGKADD